MQFRTHGFWSHFNLSTAHNIRIRKSTVELNLDGFCLFICHLSFYLQNDFNWLRLHYILSTYIQTHYVLTLKIELNWIFDWWNRLKVLFMSYISGRIDRDENMQIYFYWLERLKLQIQNNFYEILFLYWVSWALIADFTGLEMGQRNRSLRFNKLSL